MQRNSSPIFSDAYQAVEVVIPGVAGGQLGTQFNFPDLPYLRPNMAAIQAIEVYTLATQTNGPISGNPLPSLAVMQKSVITLYGGIDGVKQGNQIIQQMPLLRLNNIQNATPDPFSTNMMRFNNLQVDWTKSFIQLASAPANTVSWSYFFGIYFNFIDPNAVPGQPMSLMNNYNR